MITFSVASIIILGVLANSLEQALDLASLIVVLFVMFALLAILVDHLVKRRNRDR